MVGPVIAPKQEKRAEEKSLLELVQELMQESSLLIQKEFELLREELNLAFRRMGTASVKFVVAGVLAFISIGFLGYSLIVLLSAYITPWISAVIVGLAFLLAGLVLVWWGVADFRKLSFAARTAATIKENAKWLSKRPNRPSEK
jgi:hypothetical protein